MSRIREQFKRAICFVLTGVMLFTSDYGAGIPVYAAGSPSDYTLYINGKEAGESPVELTYGEPIEPGVLGSVEGDSIEYFYSTDAEFIEATLSIGSGETFAKSLDLDTLYYVAWEAEFANEEGMNQYYEDATFVPSFIVRKATISAPTGLSFSTWNESSESYKISFSRPTTAANGSSLDPGSIKNYTVKLFYNDELYDTLTVTSSSDTITEDISEYVTDNYGSWSFSVCANVSDGKASLYNSSVDATGGIFVNTDVFAPVISSTDFDPETSTISMEATDEHTGICAFAIDNSSTKSAEASGWTEVTNPGRGETLDGTVLYKVLGTADNGGTYYLHVKDAQGNVTTSDTSYTLTKITYVNDGKEDSTLEDTAYFFEEDEFTYKIPERPGYTFEGWFDDSGLITPASSKAVKGTDSTVYAKWSFIGITFTKQPDSEGDISREYDATDITLEATLSNVAGTIGYQWYKKNGTEWEAVSGATSNTLTLKHVAQSGTYRVKVSLALNDQNVSTDSNSVTITISPATLTVTAENKETLFMGTQSAYTSVITGFKGTDTKDNINLTQGTVTCPSWDAAVAGGYYLAKGEYPIVPTDFSAPDYVFEYVNGILTVGSKDVNAGGSNVTLVISEDEYTYALKDGTPVQHKPDVTASDNGVPIPSSQYDVEYINNANAGTATVRLTFKNNYTGVLEKNFTIKKAEFEATVHIDDYKYGDDVLPNPTVSSENGGALSFVYYKSDNTLIGAAKPVNAGTYRVVGILGATANYEEYHTEPYEFTVYPRSIVITAKSGEWEYDGNAKALDDYTQTGDGFVNGEDFQSVMVTGTITNQGTVVNHITYKLPDDVLASNYDISCNDGVLKVTRSTLPIPGGIKWLTDDNTGIAEWVPIVKNNLTVKYEVQLYRVYYENSQYKYAAVGEPTEVNTYNCDFAPLIYEDSASWYANEGHTTSVGYVYTVQAIPSGGTARDNYTRSEISDYTELNHIGTSYYSVSAYSGDDGITFVGIGRRGHITDDFSSDLIVIQGEALMIEAGCTLPYTLISNVWTVDACGNAAPSLSYGGNAYENATRNYQYISAQSPIDLTKNYHTYIYAATADRAPEISSYTSELNAARNKATLTFTASDGIGLAGWKIVNYTGKINEAPASNSAVNVATESTEWSTAGISSNRLNLESSIEVEDAGNYFLFVKDTAGNVVGGWLYGKADDYVVKRVYTLSFTSTETCDGTMPTILKLEDVVAKLPSVKFSIRGKVFKNWQTVEGSILENEANYVLNQSDTLNAIWTDEQYAYTVNYHFQTLVEEAGVYSPVYDATDISSNETATFKEFYGAVVDPTDEAYAAITKSRQGYTLDTDETGTLDVSENGQSLDVYYKLNQYTITYSYKNKSNVEVPNYHVSTLYYGEPVTDYTAPTESIGYTFSGWSYGESGQKPETMPAGDLPATGYFSADSVTYTVYYYMQNVRSNPTDPDTYSLYSTTVYNALQDEELTFGIGGMLGYVGFSNSAIVAGYGATNSSTYPGDDKLTATGTATCEEGAELYFSVYIKRKGYAITLNVWKGDRLEDTSTKFYTHTWTGIPYGSTLSAELLDSYANYEKDTWETAAANHVDDNGNPAPVDLEGYILADYVDWSTETAPTNMPAGNVIVTREYVLAKMATYYIDLFLEQADGTYKQEKSLVYSGPAGATVEISNEEGNNKISYDTLAETVAGFRYYQYKQEPDEVLSGTVVDVSGPEGVDLKSLRLHLKVYFERKSYKVTINNYKNVEGEANRIGEKIEVYRKWGTYYTFDPDTRFDYNATTLAEGSDTTDMESFRNKGYVVSFVRYWWTADTNTYGTGGTGHSNVTKLTSYDGTNALINNYDIYVGMNDSTYVNIYYTEPEIDKSYKYEIGYNSSIGPGDTAKLYFPTEGFVPLTYEAKDGTSYNIIVANERDIYETTYTDAAEYALYPGLVITQRHYIRTKDGSGKPIVKTGTGYTLTEFEYKNKTYYLPTDDSGNVYFPNNSNDMYEGNYIGFNYSSILSSEFGDSNGPGYQDLRDYENQYKSDHGESTKGTAQYDPDGAETIILYNPGASHNCRNHLENHKYQYCWYYQNYFNVTYFVEGVSCSAHRYLYGTEIKKEDIGCTHERAFPVRKGYSINWYSDALFTNEADTFTVRANVAIYGRYERTVHMNNEFLCYELPVDFGIKVGSANTTYGGYLTPAQIADISANGRVPNSDGDTYIVTTEETTTNVTIYDDEVDRNKTIKCTNTTYYINDFPVLTNRIRPAITFSNIVLAIEEEGHENDSLDYYAPTGFSFAKDNTNNKLKGYVQYNPISLYAYYTRNRYGAYKVRRVATIENADHGIYFYGNTVTLEKLGDGTDYTRVGFDYAGWKVYAGYNEDNSVTGLTDITDSVNMKTLANGGRKFMMPNTNVTVEGQWSPADFDYDVISYFQDDFQQYNSELVSDLMTRDDGEECTVNGHTGLVFKTGDDIDGASYNDGDYTYYFSKALEDEDEAGVINCEDSGLLAIVKTHTFTSLDEYEAQTVEADISAFDMFRYAYTQYRYLASNNSLKGTETFSAHPDMKLANYYERTTDYSIVLKAIATDGLDTDTTLSGAGNYYYGATVVMNASLAEGYNFKGWFDHDDIYDEDGNLTRSYLNQFTDATYTGDDVVTLVPVFANATESIAISKKYNLVAVIEPKEVTVPPLTVKGKFEYTYGYAYSASNYLSVVANMAGLDSAVYISGYQWYVKAPGSTEYEIIDGADAATYIIPAGKRAGDYSYRCNVTVARTDNGRSKNGTVIRAVVVHKAEFNISSSAYTTEYNGYDHSASPNFPSDFTSEDAVQYGICVYYSKQDISSGNAEALVAAGKAKYGTYQQFANDGDYRYRNVKVDGDENPVYQTNYLYFVDPQNNIEEKCVSCSVKITPHKLGLKSTGKAFTKVYDGNKDIDGNVITEGDEKREIATNGYYTVTGTLSNDQADSAALLDFDATYNNAHEKYASAVSLTNIKVVYADGHTNYNYIFGSSYQLDIPANVTPFPLQAVWDSRRTFVYNGELQAPTAEITYDPYSPDSDFDLTITGKQTNVGDNYLANVVVEDKLDELGNYVYYSSDYYFATEGCPFAIVKKNILVTPVTETYTYDGTKHQLVTVDVSGYTDNDMTGDVSGAGLIEGQTITNKFNKGYTDAGTYTDILATDIKIEETVALPGGGTQKKTTTGNYNIVYDYGTMIINKRVVTIDGIQAEDKIYDGNRNATLVYSDESGSLVTYGNKIAGDSLSYDATKISGLFDTPLVGTDKDVTVSFAAGALTGTDIRNYLLDDTPYIVKADIEGQGLKATATPQTIVYGETIPFGVVYTGFENGEDESVVTGTPVYKIYKWADAGHTSKTYITKTNPDVGTYYIELDLTGVSGGNYNLSWNSTAWSSQTLTVTKRPITVKTADKAAVSYSEEDAVVITKNFSGDVSANDRVRAKSAPELQALYEFDTYNSRAASGIVPGEESLVSLVVDSTNNPQFEARYNSKNVAEADRVTLSNLKINNENYELKNTSIVVKGKINAIPLTITATDFTGDKTLTYGTATNPTYTCTATGFLASEAETEKAKITYTSTFDVNDPAKRNAGTGYVITPVYTNTNYIITIVPGSLSVNKAKINVKPVPARSIVYGKYKKDDPTLGFPTVNPSFTGWKYTDNADVITSGADTLAIDCAVTPDNAADKEPGTYTINYTTASVANLAATNYEFVRHAGTLKIDKQEISVTGIVIRDRLYDGTNKVNQDQVDLDNAVITYFINGVKKNAETTDDVYLNLHVEGTYSSKNVIARASANNNIDLELTLINDFAKYYDFRATTSGDDLATQTKATAGINPAPLTLTARARELHFGDVLTFDTHNPGAYVISGETEPGHDFVTYTDATGTHTETYTDLYGNLTYRVVDGADKAYKKGSPAGEYTIKIGGFVPGADQTQNYDITFNNDAAIVMTISPATLATPVPVWSTAEPGKVSWPAVPNIGDDTDDGILVRVLSYEVKLFKGTTEIEGTTHTVQYVEGQSTYSYDYEYVVRANGPGLYHVKVTAEASTVDNAAYCNVNRYSARGATSAPLAAKLITVQFASDATTTAGKATEGTPISIGANDGAGNIDAYSGASVTSYLMLSGEKNVPLHFVMINETGYKRNTYTVSAQGELTIPANDTQSGADYTNTVSLKSGLTNSDARTITVSLKAVPATLSATVAVVRNNPAKWGYDSAMASVYRATAAVEDGDNITTDGYAYTYQWYTKDKKSGTYAGPIDVTANETYNYISEYLLPPGKKVANSYYAKCVVTATRLDNGLSKTVGLSGELYAIATVERADLKDIRVVSEFTGSVLDWQYGTARTSFKVNPNPDEVTPTFYYRKQGTTEWSTAIPKDVGAYEAYANLPESEHYAEYDTSANDFVITRAKLTTPSKITMNASSTAPYGLIKWTGAPNVVENANTGGVSDMTVKPSYRVSFWYRPKDAAKSADTKLKEVIINDLQYDFTDQVNEAGIYTVKVTAIVNSKNNAAATLTRARANVEDSDTNEIEAVISIGDKVTWTNKVYDGTPLTMSVTYDNSGLSDYQWLKDKVPVTDVLSMDEGGQSYGITYVEESATYICEIWPNGYENRDEPGGAPIFSAIALPVISPRPVTIESGSSTKTYDGLVLTNETVNVKSTTPLPTYTGGGDVLVSGATGAHTTASITKAGSTGNTITGVIIKHGDKVVYEAGAANNNYTVTLKPGTLKVNKKDVTVTANTKTKVYDGTALTDVSFNNTALAVTDDITANVSGSIIHVTAGNNTGVETNTISNIKITHNTLGDVTASYNVTPVNGILTITRRPITITAGSTTRDYNTTKLTNHTYQVTSGSFAAGDGLAVADIVWAGEITNVGEDINEITSWTIKNGAGENVNRDYAVTPVDGLLKINKATETITIISTTAQDKVYDGVAYANPTISCLGVTDGNGTASFVYYDEDKNALSGAPVNVGDYFVKGFVKNSTNYNNAETDYVGFKITKRPITITASSASREYNGAALTANSWVTLVPNLATASRDKIVSVNIAGTITNAGTVDNVASLAVIKNNNGSGSDVTANYNITYVKGSLKITKKHIDITAASNHWTYDGNAHTDAGYSITSGALASTDRLTATTVTGTITNYVAAGVSNVPSAAVIKNGNGEGEDIALTNYDISYNDGLLKIDKRAITITAKNAEKVYDGTPLTKNNALEDWEITSGTLASNEEIASVTITGSQTIKGQSSNVPSAAVIKRGSAETQGNYAISYANGTLKVTAKAVTFISNSNSWMYDGAVHKDEGFTYKNGIGIAATDTAVVTYGKTIQDYGNTANTIASIVIKNSSDQDVTSSYTIGKETGTLRITKREITITAKSDSKTYDTTPLTNSGYDVSGYGLADTDEITSISVTGSRTNVGESANTVSGAQIKRGSTNTNGNYTIHYVAGTLTITKADDEITFDPQDKSYDGAVYSNPAVTCKGRTDGGGTVSYKYYELSGTEYVEIPAPVNVGTWYVKAFIKGSSNYNNAETEGYAAFNINKRVIKIKALDAEKFYDGTPLTKNEASISEGTLATASHDKLVSITVTGSITEYGTEDNVPSGAVIKNNNGAGEDVTANYDIEYVNGTLTVTRPYMVIEAKSAHKTYDGTPLTMGGLTGYTIKQGGLAVGDRIASIDIAGTITNYTEGGVPNVASNVVILNSSDEVVTGSYEISYNDGLLTIDKRAITITAKNAEKVYDGTPLTKNNALEDWTLTSGTLADNETITSVTITGSRTVRGQSSNVPSNAVIKRAGAETQNNYAVTYVDGTLTVTPKAVTFVSNSHSWKYDGYEHSDEGFTYKNDIGIAATDNVTVTYGQSILFVGTVQNTMASIVIKNGSDQDVTDSYTITREAGTLEVYKRNITVRLRDAEKEYDGQPVPEADYKHVDVGGDGLAYDDDLTTFSCYSVNQVDAGEYEARLVYVDITRYNEITHSNDRVNDNYDITYLIAHLTIRKAPEVLQVNQSGKVYDGTAVGSPAITKKGNGQVAYKYYDISGTEYVEISAPVKVGTWYVKAEINNSGNYLDAVSDYISFEITKKPVSIKAKDAHKLYDLEPLTCNEAEMADNTSLATGDRISDFSVTGSRTEVGSSDNVLNSVSIENQADEDVTYCYDITKKNGTLSVTRGTQIINAPDVTVQYDNHVHSIVATTNGNGTISYSDNNELIYPGHETVTINASETLSYLPAETTAELTVTKRKITITAASAEKEYDGKPLTAHKYKITKGSLAEGDVISEVAYSGSITNVGSKKNEITDISFNDASGHPVNDYYEITLVKGTLTVTEVPAAPAEPDEPDEPVNPIKPVDPNKPIDPVRPVPPEIHIEPVDPTKPDEPGTEAPEPGKKDPEAPDKPEPENPEPVISDPGDEDGRHIIVWAEHGEEDSDNPIDDKNKDEVERVVDEILTPEEEERYEGGEDVEIRLVVDTEPEKILPEPVIEDLEALGRKTEEENEGHHFGGILDIILDKRIGSEDWQEVPEIESMIEVVIDIPLGQRHRGAKYYLIRTIDGKEEILEDLDDDPNTITIRVNKFGPAALIYIGGEVCWCHWIIIMIALITLILQLLCMKTRKSKDDDDEDKDNKKLFAN